MPSPCGLVTGLEGHLPLLKDAWCRSEMMGWVRRRSYVHCIDQFFKPLQSGPDCFLVCLKENIQSVTASLLICARMAFSRPHNNVMELESAAKLCAAIRCEHVKGLEYPSQMHEPTCIGKWLCICWILVFVHPWILLIYLQFCVKALTNYFESFSFFLQTVLFSVSCTSNAMWAFVHLTCPGRGWNSSAFKSIPELTLVLLTLVLSLELTFILKTRVY